MRGTGTGRLAVAAVALAGGLLLPSAAGADGVPAAGCRPRPYPAGAGTALQLGSTRPTAGVAFAVAGLGFCAGEPVELTAGGRPAAGVTAGADGTFAGVAVTLRRPGPARICAVRPGGRPPVCASVDAAAVAAPRAAGAHSARTGVEVAALVALAAVLLATGLALATAGRRRPAADAG